MLFTPEKNALEIFIDQIPLHDDQFQELTINDAIASDDAGSMRRKMTELWQEYYLANISEIRPGKKRNWADRGISAEFLYNIEEIIEYLQYCDYGVK